MKKQYKLGIIGCSENTTSLVRGVVLSEFLKEKKVIVSDESDDELDKIEEYGVHTSVDNRFVAENSEFLVIGVKPSKFPEVVKSLGGYCPEKIISLMDGVKKNAIKNALGIGVIKVARCTMNMPCEIGSGVIGIEYSDFSKSMDDTDFINNALSTMGTLIDVSEAKIDTVTAVGKDGCALALMLIDSLVSAGVKNGLTKDEAKIAAVQAFFGSAELASREEKTLDELLVQSCKNSPSALEAVKTVENSDLRSIIESAVDACVKHLEKTEIL